MMLYRTLPSLIGSLKSPPFINRIFLEPSKNSSKNLHCNIDQFLTNSGKNAKEGKVSRINSSIDANSAAV